MTGCLRPAPSCSSPPVDRPSLAPSNPKGGSGRQGERHERGSHEQSTWRGLRCSVKPAQRTLNQRVTHQHAPKATNNHLLCSRGESLPLAQRFSRWPSLGLARLRRLETATACRLRSPETTFHRYCLETVREYRPRPETPILQSRGVPKLVQARARARASLRPPCQERLSPEEKRRGRPARPRVRAL